MRSCISTAHHTHMKKILLVFTGGTIGSASENGTIDASDQARFKLLELFERHYADASRVDFKILQPFRLLSENLHPTVWEQLIAAIENENPADYDGIIVTHGTDTLAFTGAALGLYFNRLTIPLMLVSSNHPVDHPDANGLDNFICAVEYIVQGQPAGVWVPYKNPGHPMRVHIGTRLASSLQLSSDFISVQSRFFMEFDQGRFTVVHPLDRSVTANTKLKPLFSGDILLLRPYPGLNYAHLSLDGVEAVLHDLYHSGTACVSADYGKQHSLPDFVDRCRQREIKIYLAPALHHPELYRSTRELTERGAEMIWNTSLESAYVKLSLAYANFDDPRAIGDLLRQNIALEQL